MQLIWKDNQNYKTGTRILRINATTITKSLCDHKNALKSIEDMPKIAINGTESEKSYEQTMKLKSTEGHQPLPSQGWSVAMEHRRQNQDSQVPCDQ